MSRFRRRTRSGWASGSSSSARDLTFGLDFGIVLFMAQTSISRSGHTYSLSADSGDGYWCPEHLSDCQRSCEDRRWGRFGAAGVLFWHRESGRFFLNQRSPLVHLGGTWSVLGGALDRGETAAEGALREAAEEMGFAPQGRVVAQVTDRSAGEWTYTTVIVEVSDLFAPTKMDWESSGFGWFSVSEMASLRLHPGFRSSVHKVLAAVYFGQDMAL